MNYLRAYRLSLKYFDHDGEKNNYYNHFNEHFKFFIQTEHFDDHVANNSNSLSIWKNVARASYLRCLYKW